MRYYIVDNKGDVYGDCENKERAKMLLESTLAQLKEEHPEIDYTSLELEVIEGN